MIATQVLVQALTQLDRTLLIMSALTQQIWNGFLIESLLILFMDLIIIFFYAYATPCITTGYDFIFYITGADCPRSWILYISEWDY